MKPNRTRYKREGRQESLQRARERMRGREGLAGVKDRAGGKDLAEGVKTLLEKEKKLAGGEKTDHTGEARN